MLTAIDKKGKKTAGWDAVKEDLYYCPSCEERLILRQGEIKVHHFAHSAETGCRYIAGETEEHLLAKKILFQKFLESGLYRDIELEHKIGEHIADLYLINGQNKQIVVECQSSNPDITDFRRKTASYSYRGIYVMWIFLLNSELDKCFVKLIHAGDSRLNYESSEIERRCHRWYYGRFYYFYNNKIYAVHFHPIDRWVPSSCEECLRQSDCSFPHPSKCPEYREGYFRRPKALREISIYPVDNPKLVCIDRKDKLRIAKFNEPAWWKV